MRSPVGFGDLEQTEATFRAAESLDSFDPLSPWVVADARRRSSSRLLGAVGVSPTARPRRAIAVASGARAR